MRLNKSYLRSLLIGMQIEFQYRSNIFFGMLRAVIGLVAVSLLWSTVYTQTDMIAGYTLQQMYGYYLFALMIAPFLDFETDWMLWSNIKSGKLSNYLLLPADYFWLTTCKNTGRILGGLIFVPLALVPAAVILGVVVDAAGLGLLTVCQLINAILLCRVLSFVRGVLGFWMQEVGIIGWVDRVIIALLAGQYFPVSLFPQPLRTIVEWLPFQAILYTPIHSIIAPSSSSGTLPLKLLYNVGWTVLLYASMRYLWKKGVRRYQAVGG